MSRHHEDSYSIPPWVGSLGIIFVVTLFGMFFVFNSQLNDSRSRVTSLVQSAVEKKDPAGEPSPEDWKQFTPIQTSSLYEGEEEIKFDELEAKKLPGEKSETMEFTEVVPVSELLGVRDNREQEEAIISEVNTPVAQPPLAAAQNGPDLGDNAAFSVLEGSPYMDIAFSSPQYVVKDLGFGPVRQKRQRTPLSGWFTMAYPLRDPDTRDDGQSGVLNYPTLESTLQYKPNNWFFRLSFYSYLKEEDQRTWDPDYEYKFGYKNWRPNSFSLWYRNGGRNRLNPDRGNGETYTRPEDGEIIFRYNLPKFSKLENLLKLTSSSSLGANVKYQMIPRQDYWDDDTRYRMHWKQYASFYTWYNFTRKFYIGASVNYYPDNNQRSWDPDYTYEIGLADWSPGKLSLEYGNYDRNNRFPWRSNNEGSSSLFDGSLSLSLYWRF